jgi:predicted helicase
VPDTVLRHLEISDKDLGIDLVAESKGEYHAIQCKYHGNPERNVQFKEVSTFLSYYNSRDKFTHAVICSNANDLSKNLIQVIDQGKSVTSILAEQFTGMSQELFDAIKGKIEEKEVNLAPFQPRPHQQKAINDAIQYFVEERNDRGKLIFPCGSGKSLTGYWIAETLEANSVLVAVPSLALVKQTLEVYLREISAKRESVEWLCVCSDAGIGKSDDVLYHTYNLGVPCTTDIDKITDWLKENRGKGQLSLPRIKAGKQLQLPQDLRNSNLI